MAIPRAGLKKNNDLICSRLYLSGKPAVLKDDTNLDWLSSLHFGPKSQ